MNAVGVELLIRRLAVDACGDSALSGSLIFGTWSAVVERGGSGVSALSSDVIDLIYGGMCE